MFLDVVLALFAAVGIFSCFFCLLCLMLPRHPSVLLVDCRGVQTREELWSALWQCRTGVIPRRILLVDCALSEQERFALCQKYPAIEFCGRSQLADKLRSTYLD